MPLPCPRCHVEHHDREPCLEALARAVQVLSWELRELRAALDHERAERRRRDDLRTLRSRLGRAGGL